MDAANCERHVEDGVQKKNERKAMQTKTNTSRNSKEQARQIDELIVQRLSADVHGRAQKYSRVGPMEFVVFSGLEITTD